MNRQMQIDNFLKKCRNVMMNNPSFEISEKEIYQKLMEYGLTEEEKDNSNIEYLFLSWINKFKDSRSLDVYHDLRQKAFLQFRTRNNNDCKCVKLYLSFPKDKIEYCVNKIFNYIDINNMKTLSKVARRVRSDSVVCRMNNYDEAIKLMNYINSDLELSTYAKDVNPFMMKNGVVGVSYDDNLSYNSTLTFMIRNYLYDALSNNNINNISRNSFKDYVDKFSNDVFGNGKRLKEFVVSGEFKDSISRFATVGEEIVNYQKVISLISLQLDDNMNINTFKSFYDEAINDKKTYDLANYYEDCLSRENSNEESNVRVSNIIKEYIVYAYQKYQDINMVVNHLNGYMATNNIMAITRDNGLRDKFKMYVSARSLYEEVANDVYGYVSNILGDFVIVKESCDEYNLFIDACYETFYKYGALQLQEAIKQGLKHNYAYFTNGDRGYRQILQMEDDNFANYCIRLYNDNVANDENAKFYSLEEGCTKAIELMVNSYGQKR